MADIIKTDVFPIQVDSVESRFAELDILLEEDFSSPTKIKRDTGLKSKNTNLAYAYYIRVRPDLADWWDEFNELNEQRISKYRNIRQFAKSRTEDKKEQGYIMEMIGPKKPDNEVLEIPWLGDWQLRRANGYWIPDQAAKLRTLVTAIKSKQQSWDAVRSCAPFLTQQFAKYKRLEEQIDEAFGGRAFVPDKPGDDKENQSRFDAYWKMQTAVTAMYFSLNNEWRKVFGCDPEKIQVMQVQGNVNTQVNNETSFTQTNTQNLTANELEVIKLAQQLKFNEKTYSLPLPKFSETTASKSESPKPTDTVKNNGKIQ